MRSFLLPVFAFGLLSLTAPNPLISPAVLHERRNHVPSGWLYSHKHDASSVLHLRFGLTQPNVHLIEEYLNDIAHPQSSNYGNHWTSAQVFKKFAPGQETVQTVKNWLLDAGFNNESIRITRSRSWIEVDATVKEAERLLNAEYHVYKHESGIEHVCCESYHLPSHVAPHVDLVTPTVHFNIIHRSSILNTRGPAVSSAPKIGVPGKGFEGPKTTGKISKLYGGLFKCDEQITPTCLRALYGLVYEPLAASKNSYAIVEYTPQAYIPSDLDNFSNTYAKDFIGKRPNLVSIDGGFVQTNRTGFRYNAESNLDLQYAMSLVTKQNITLYQAGDNVKGASFNNMLDALDGPYCTFDGGDDPTKDATYSDTSRGGYEGKKNCGTVTPANVISTSYNYNEADLTPAYTARQCLEYAKLGLMGVTVLFSSGDFGVAGYNGVCLNHNGTQSRGAKRFNPSFPGSCPYVTSVGATQVNPNSTVFQPESACEQIIYSGGGFSNHFAIPEYQKNAVRSYLKNYPPPFSKNLYNSTGRAFPDLSANGANYVVSVQGDFNLIYGTSASSPVVGSILTLVNDARLAIGKKPIGFINPTIYSTLFAGAFNDIINGTNQGCGTPGFNSTPGWDPVTGLGTPNFPKLVAQWLLLP